MLVKISFSVILTCLVVQNVSTTEDVLIQIQSKRFVNEISDNFISFSIDPKNLLSALNGSSTGSLVREIKQLSPSYLRIAGPSTNELVLGQNAGSTLTEPQMEISLKDWKRLYKMIRLMDLKPIIALPYNPKKWNARQAIQILDASNSLGFEECIWQLGSDFNTTDAINYVDDLSTLRTIVDAFVMKNARNKWSVVGTDLSEGSNEDEARLYSELSLHTIDAVGWVQSYDYSPADSIEDYFIGKDRALRTLLNGELPVWFTLTQATPFFVTKQTCSPQCQQHGLSWAKTLGDASLNGFKTVFTPIDLATVTTPSLSYFISLLHKKLVGDEVFDTRMLAGSRLSSQFYSYCARNISGAFTVMSINADDSRLRVVAKMPNAYTGSEVHQYVLSVDAQSGAIQLNGETVTKNSALMPIVRAKRSSKTITFSLPALSVGFWVLPHANLRECINFNAAAHAEQKSNRDGRSGIVKGAVKTSKELLLQQLIVEAIDTGDKPKSARAKRHAVMESDAPLAERERRDITNAVPIDEELDHPVVHRFTDELNGENADSSILQRNRRFIMDSNRPRRNLVDIIYKEVDDVKRKQIFAPYNSRNTAIFGRHARQKRQLAPGFAKLFEKFELMKPKKLGFKPVAAFNINDKSAIPPIATVHDIYSPHPAEMKVFRSSENRDLPHGDVYLELDNGQPSPDYVEYDDGDRQSQRHGSPARDEPEDAALHNLPHEYLEHMAGEFERPRAMTRPGPQYPQMASRRGELMEADVYHRASAASPDQRAQQERPSAPQREVEFVVQELQPTWHKNRENLMTARNNLQTYYAGNQGQPIVTGPYAPHGGYEEDYDSSENGFFRSNRRRRSVDSAMNDQIEEKLKQLEEAHAGINDARETNRGRADVNDDAANAVDKINLLDKMLQIVDHIHRTKNSSSDENYNKLSAEIKELESFIYRKIPLIENQFLTRNNRLAPADVRRKCKVMATSLEQRCLRDEEQFEKNIFKREAKLAHEDKTVKHKPLRRIAKKLFPKTAAAIAEKRKLREKRNTIHKLVPLEEDVFISNHIKRGMGEDIPVMKAVYVRHDVGETTTQPQEQQQPDDKSADSKGIQSTISRIKNEHFPKIVRTVTGVAGSVFGAVHKHVSGWWKMLS